MLSVLRFSPCNRSFDRLPLDVEKSLIFTFSLNRICRRDT